MPPMSVQRSSKSTLSQVRNFLPHFFLPVTAVVGISSEGYSGKGFVTHK
jgi:hypothetical protein